MKLVSWNVNGIRACVKKGFEEFFSKADADIFCVQETKMQISDSENSQDIKEIMNMPIFNNYFSYWNSAEKKGYSGTAIFTKIEPISYINGIGIEKNEKKADNGISPKTRNHPSNAKKRINPGKKGINTIKNNFQKPTGCFQSFM